MVEKERKSKSKRDNGGIGEKIQAKEIKSGRRKKSK